MQNFRKNSLDFLICVMSSMVYSTQSILKNVSIIFLFKIDICEKLPRQLYLRSNLLLSSGTGIFSSQLVSWQLHEG